MKITKQHMLLYAVTDRSHLGGQSLEEAVEEILSAGATLLQLREKHLGEQEFLEQAQRLLPICRRHGVPLIINDSVSVAVQSGADGVHIGLGDMAIQKARQMLGPEKIIGASVHSVQEALAAAEAGADYLGCGAVFGTQTKKDAGLLPHETLRAICAAVDLPIVAIGGIGEQNILQLCGTGADGVAVISALFSQKDKAAATRRLLALSRQMIGGAQ
ncbi:thiamine phosphate synthase [Christensenellaceae bacterium 44-20]